ncbi:MAG: ATP-binding protein [Bacteroidales bacterium]|nr:ATP-binding protein [Bacteroidales bacterium]
MNRLEKKLEILDSGLQSRFQETKMEVELLLSKYDSNFPTYTDHSIKHSLEVFKLISELLTPKEIDNLNSDEIYILSMASILHDIGMCLPDSEIINIYNEKFNLTDKPIEKIVNENIIREIHHELSYEFIIKEYNLLKIPNEKYAVAIGLVAKGHRKVALDDIDIYKPKFFVKSGREFVCLPYLASILRLADELDITNIRTPYLLTKYYMPKNEVSIKEWKKHISTTQINFTEDQILFEVNCSDQNNYAALQEQFEKIQNQSYYCQKIIRTISNTEDRKFELSSYRIIPNYKFLGFDPKGIKFSFNVKNVVKTFIGEDLYENNLVAIREVVQNAIDTCRYKQNIFKSEFSPEIKILIEDNFIQISDNGLGMDEFVIENFFGRLGSSFYEQEKVKKEFEAIGQFGVGVFSYFLLGEYIDIETKTENGTPLKFRIDKDPNNYFHFFEETKRKNTGTTITLHLKDETKEKYSFNDYYNYILNTFRHLEFPLIVTDKNTVYEVSSASFSLQPKVEIQKYIRLKNKNIANQFTIIKHSIKHDDYEGESALIVKTLTKKNIKQDGPLYFEYDSFNTIDYMHDQSQIAISQKGVFVNNYSSGYLALMIGDINLKKGEKININRKEFVQQESVSAIIGVFIAGLIDKYFTEIKKHFTIEERAKITDSFLQYYLGTYFPNKNNFNNLKTVLENNLIVRFIENNLESLITFIEIEQKSNEFILLPSIENKSELRKFSKLPILMASVTADGDGTYETIYSLLKDIFNYTPKVFVSANRAYQIFYKCENDNYKDVNTKLRDLSIYRIKDAQFIDSKYIAVKISKNKKELQKLRIYYTDLIINATHPYLMFIIKHYNTIKDNTEFEKIIKTSFDIIREINDSKKVVQRRIKELNQILDPLSVIEQPWRFTIDDFQPTN